MKTLSPPMRRVVYGSWLMILVLTLATVILYVDNKRTKECLEGYIKADRAATVPRIEAGAQANAAMDKLVEELLNVTEKGQSRRILEGYQAVRRVAREKVAANPVPPFPEHC